MPYIPESPKIAADVIKDSIENHPDAPGMEFPYQLGHGFIGAEASVYAEIIGGIVSMSAGFKERSQIEAIDTQAEQMRDPGPDLIEAWLRFGMEIIPFRGAAKPEWIEVIKDGIL